jgi:hypothetical protein
MSDFLGAVSAPPNLDQHIDAGQGPFSTEADATHGETSAPAGGPGAVFKWAYEIFLFGAGRKFFS